MRGKLLQTFLTMLPLMAAAEPQLAPIPEPGAPPATIPMPQPTEQKEQVLVLGYGRFSAQEGQGGINEETFARQMDYLQAHGLRPISLQAYLDWRGGRISLPQGSVLITLDEADKGAYQVAYPVLRRHKFPYVVFVDSHNLSMGDAEYATLPQLQEMVMNGAEIGSHTMNRPESYEWQFAAMSGGNEFAALAERELGNSTRSIAAAFHPCRAFSYPRGVAEDNLSRALPQYGIQVAFDTQGGASRRDTPAFKQHRFMVTDEESFNRAVNQACSGTPEPAPQADAESMLEPVETDIPVQPQKPQPAVVFEDDDVAEEVDEPAVEPAQEVQEAYPPVTPLYENLGRRTPDGDWVTSRFAAPLVERERTRVAVLGYHNFSNTKPATEMRMHTSDFCQQMQYIKDAGLSVITMQDFLEWLNGTRRLPERCVLITIDDGWKSVYTDAFPVLRAYGYPFTMFLYTTYIDVQGDSMTVRQLQAMMRCGATIGSHSVNHLYPKKWKRYAMESAQYKTQLQVEFLDSRAKLVELFGNCSTYCFPGGYNTPPMLETLASSPYQAAFTVEEAKVGCTENRFLIHRYMVFGIDHNIFRRAVNFDGDAGIRASREGIQAALPRAMKFFPSAFPKTVPQPQPKAVKKQAKPVKTKPAAPLPAPVGNFR